MLMKLVLPDHSRMFEGGVVLHWLKGEGEWIDYGEDLLELQFERVRVTKTVLASNPRQWLDEMAEHMRGTNSECGPKEEAGFQSWSAVVILRIRSSDMGYLRKHCAQVGEERATGELLALLTTEEGEAVGESPDALARASVFRVVVDMAEPDGGAS